MSRGAVWEHRIALVSMESGLEGRNNHYLGDPNRYPEIFVSMESGLEGRNNYIVDWPNDQWYGGSQWSPA